MARGICQEIVGERGCAPERNFGIRIQRMHARTAG